MQHAASSHYMFSTSDTQADITGASKPFSGTERESEEGVFDEWNKGSSFDYRFVNFWNCVEGGAGEVVERFFYVVDVVTVVVFRNVFTGGADFEDVVEGVVDCSIPLH